jgi:hypothetical protein
MASYQGNNPSTYPDLGQTGENLIVTLKIYLNQVVLMANER